MNKISKYISVIRTWIFFDNVLTVSCITLIWCHYKGILLKANVPQVNALDFFIDHVHIVSRVYISFAKSFLDCISLHYSYFVFYKNIFGSTVLFKVRILHIFLWFDLLNHYINCMAHNAKILQHAKKIYKRRHI